MRGTASADPPLFNCRAGGRYDLPLKTDPNIMLGPERKIFRRRQVNGTEKVHPRADHPKTPQKLKC